MAGNASFNSEKKLNMLHHTTQLSQKKSRILQRKVMMSRVKSRKNMPELVGSILNIAKQGKLISKHYGELLIILRP